MFVEYKRYLPWSGRRYFLNQFGEVFKSDGEKLQVHTGEQGSSVVIDWVLGRRSYPVALLILYSFEQVTLPDYLIDEIEVLYRDGSKSNLNPSNLFYRFKNGPLEVEERPGFYYIPMYANYAINRAGDLINLASGQFKTWSITRMGGPKNQTGGYHYTRVVTDSGFSKVLFKHRALCMVFKSYGEDMIDLVVNHLDGNPGNNVLENLEWTTYKKNNEHALSLGLKKSTKAVLVKDLKTGDVERYPSASECGRNLNPPRREKYVLERIRVDRNGLPPDGLIFKYDDESEWRSYDGVNEINRRIRGSKILGRNVFTGEIISFTTCGEGEYFSGVKSATILKHIKTKEDLPVGGYNFRYSDEVEKWPQHPERNLLIYRDFPIYPRDGVEELDLQTNTVKFYTSTTEVRKKYGISKSGFSEIVKNQKTVQGRYLFSIYKLKEAIVRS